MLSALLMGLAGVGLWAVQVWCLARPDAAQPPPIGGVRFVLVVMAAERLALYGALFALVLGR